MLVTVLTGLGIACVVFLVSFLLQLRCHVSQIETYLHNANVQKYQRQVKAYIVKNRSHDLLDIKAFFLRRLFVDINRQLKLKKSPSDGFRYIAIALKNAGNIYTHLNFLALQVFQGIPELHKYSTDELFIKKEMLENITPDHDLRNHDYRDSE